MVFIFWSAFGKLYGFYFWSAFGKLYGFYFCGTERIFPSHGSITAIESSMTKYLIGLRSKTFKDEVTGMEDS